MRWNINGVFRSETPHGQEGVSETIWLKLEWDVARMVVYGFDSIAPLLQQEAYLFKLLANDAAVVLFRHTVEHRDAGQPGIMYVDDASGNALAAIVKPGRIEFRFHHQYSDARVRHLTERILALPEMVFASSFLVTYQGRVVLAPRQ